MPELPEVETVCRGLAKVLQGRRLMRVRARRPDLRFPLPKDLSARVAGRRVENIYRRGKYILITLDDRQVIVAHLGMSGRMCIFTDPAPDPGPHDHVIFSTDDGRTIYFNDVRRFGFVDLTTEDALADYRFLRDLGPEPLAETFNPAFLSETLKGKNTNIKAALLDQRVVAGVGNIYACEALFRAGLSPRRKAGTVRGGRAERLVRAVGDVLGEAIAAGGSSLRDYVQPSGELGYFQHSWAVYGREDEPCPRCERPIRRLVQAGRSTFYCANCQR